MVASRKSSGQMQVVAGWDCCCSVAGVSAALRACGVGEWCALPVTPGPGLTPALRVPASAARTGRAFARLPAGAQLLVVGDGPDRPALARRAQRFGSRVQFTGFVPHAAVPAVLRNVDMLVLPGLYEDLSSALIEAMAAGLPVVATGVGGTADLVHDGVNGLLVAPRDPAALAAAISRVLADPAAAAGLAAAARRTADAYAWPDLARKVLEVYQGVTGPGRGR